MLTYVIDAYNVLHRSPRLHKKSRKDFIGAKESLTAKIRGFALHGKKDVILVFDGTGEQAPPPGPGVKCVYADPGKTADQKIKGLIDRAGNPRNLIIVSSDAEVAQYGRLNACRVVGADDFIRMLEMRGGRDENEKPVSETEREKEDWLRLFGDTK